MELQRSEILKRMYVQVAAGMPIVGGGASTGISARCQEAGGIDLIVVYNTGRFRMAGRASIAGLFAYGDANQTVLDAAGEILPVVEHTPVLAGVNATDPFRVLPLFLEQIKSLGFVGVQNWPTAGLFDGDMRLTMEANGLGYDKEVEMIALAHAADLLTAPYVFDEYEAQMMARAGADIIIPHMGLTAGGATRTPIVMTPDEAIERTLRIAAAARTIRDDVIVLCHGGPFGEPPVVAEALTRMPGVHGFFGVSSVERLPVERAITEQVERFKAMRPARAAVPAAR